MKVDLEVEVGLSGGRGIWRWKAEGGEVVEVVVDMEVEMEVEVEEEVEDEVERGGGGLR